MNPLVILKKDWAKQNLAFPLKSKKDILRIIGKKSQIDIEPICIQKIVLKFKSKKSMMSDSIDKVKCLVIESWFN